MRILIVKMWALGDILMATPLLRALKRHYPGCEITWLVEKAQAQILAGNPFVDEVIPFDSANWRRQFRRVKLVSYLRTSLSMRRMLLDRRFDIVINLTAEKWWSVWFNIAPIRVGLFPRPHAGHIGRLYTYVIERAREPFLHNTQHYLLCAAALGAAAPFEERMVVGISDEHRADAEHFLGTQPSYDAALPTVLLHPGTSQASKCWLPERYAAVADLLMGYNVVVTGSPGEQELCQTVARQAQRGGVIVAAGKLRHIGHAAALLERSAGIVTGDTSMLHMASALDIPIVGIYGSTRPRDNAPLFGRSKLLYDDSVPCAPCYKSKCPFSGEEFMRCMQGVSVEQVAQSLRELGIGAETPPVTPAEERGAQPAGGKDR